MISAAQALRDAADHFLARDGSGHVVEELLRRAHAEDQGSITETFRLETAVGDGPWSPLPGTYNTAADAREEAGMHAHSSDRGTRYRLARRSTTPWIVQEVLGNDADMCGDCAAEQAAHP